MTVGLENNRSRQMGDRQDKGSQPSLVDSLYPVHRLKPKGWNAKAGLSKSHSTLLWIPRRE